MGYYEAGGGGVVSMVGVYDPLDPEFPTFVGGLAGLRLKWKKMVEDLI